jgi:hypothetical protein
VAVLGRSGAKRLVARLRLGVPRRVSAVVLRLPAGVRLGPGSLVARLNGRKPPAVRRAGRRTIVVRTGNRRLHELALATSPGAVRITRGSPGVAKLALRGAGGRLGTLEIPLAGVPGS